MEIFHQLIGYMMMAVEEMMRRWSLFHGQTLHEVSMAFCGIGWSPFSKICHSTNSTGNRDTGKSGDVKLMFEIDLKQMV